MSRFLANDIEKLEQMVYPRVVISGVANAMWEATFGTNKVEGMLNSSGAGEAYLPKIGTWTFKMKSESGERTTTAVIESANDTVNISLAYATLTIIGDVGNTITAVNGDYSISGVVGNSGTVQFIIGNGTWALTSSDETLEVSDNVVIGDGDSNVSKTLTLPTITVTTAEGASISAVKDGVTVNGTADSNGECVLKVSVGTWEVSATNDGETKTENVVVSAHSTNVDLSFISVHIYGAQWTSGTSTAWTRTDDAASFGACNPYVSGASSYSSPFDNIMPWSGMTKSTRTGGVMVAIPKFWYKLTAVSGGGLKVQIADNEIEGFNVSPAHMNRGDGAGERDVVYVGRYHCHSTNYKSETGKTPYNNITRSTARSTIHNLGAKIWQSDFAMRFTIWLLYIVEFADWNSQVKIGYGCGNNSSFGRMGYTDSMPYHTGTTASSRTSYGLGTQYRNIEGLWDNVMDWCDGCYYNSNGMNIILNPANFSDSANGINVGTPSDSYPSKFSVTNISGTFPMFIPSESSGSDSTYTSDVWGFNASYPCLYVGGGYNQYLGCGLFYINRNSASGADTLIGARLQELP